ncbi:MAG: hypothetical protein J1E85_00050 [Ruminococcus sp.]|nr:hypothetical protein [Ruminococcus sp.]
MNIGDKVGDTKYVTEQDICIGGNHYFFAYDKGNEYPYMVGEYQANELFGIYDNCVGYSDYLTAMSEWSKRISDAITQFQTERKATGIEPITLSKDDVFPLSYADNIVDKIVVIKPSALRREYQTSEHQLYFCVGGFGAEGNSRGCAVFLHSIIDDRHTRFNREDILGIIKADKIPEWANDKVNELIAKNGNNIVSASSSIVKSIKR